MSDQAKLELVPCSLRKANDFVAQYHRHNGRTARNGGKFALGVESEGMLVGVAIVGNPISATYMDGITAEVLRLCTSPDAPKNATGTSLRAAGWKILGETKAMKQGDGWRKKDHLHREWQPIYGQAKFRWEVQE